jgi:4-hydroxybenzoate polyprenyltransferase
MGSRILAFIKATHFPQALTMVLLTTSSSWVLGQQSFVLIFVFIAVAAGQASIGWVNDRQDAKIDSALNRLEKPLVGDSLQPADLVRPIQIASALTVIFSFLAAGWIGGLANILAVASAQTYNLYLARTTWSWLPYAVSFGLLTVFVTRSSSLELWPSLQLVLIAICVGVIAHVFNALPDMQRDKQSNLGGLVVALGKPKSLAVATVLAVVILWLLLDLWLTR